ncbi:MAG: fluoride efflux transporter CrcB [Bacteroidales bacterium]
MIKLILIAGTGGFLGTVARFLASRYFQNLFLSSFPFGTFLVNIAGCLLIGIFLGLSQKGDLLSPEWRMFLTVGFCGGFTTFSAFAAENLALVKDGNFFYFALYAGLSVFLGLLATFLGNTLILKAI